MLRYSSEDLSYVAGTGDRSLENKIQVLGIGFGGGAIASGVFTTHIDKINLPIVQKHPLYASLLLSVFATLFFIGIGWLITQRQYHPRDKKQIEK
ncbi:hypothetical protein [Nostoc sp. 'Peltigera malacea cyanobiont' DB3992]|uniref:hypothetical protein n=1 Tax=Nostoc sp. 'Peltigera malacea cyanobiont' DB3992 TaxID=1206980 RepID=UPI0011815A60|nr:hypothetical protein [Nostoc sp. 'Peltigera malacea cyanobiont' DB3992]